MLAVNFLPRTRWRSLSRAAISCGWSLSSSGALLCTFCRSDSATAPRKLSPKGSLSLTLSILQLASSIFFAVLGQCGTRERVAWPTQHLEFLNPRRRCVGSPVFVRSQRLSQISDTLREVALASAPPLNSAVAFSNVFAASRRFLQRRGSCSPFSTRVPFRPCDRKRIMAGVTATKRKRWAPKWVWWKIKMKGLVGYCTS